MESTAPLNNGCLSSVASTTYVYKIFTYKLTCGRKIKSQLKVVSEPTRRLPNVTRRSHRIQYAVLLYLRVRAQTDDLPKRPQQNRAIRVRLFEMLVNTSERIRRRRRLTILLNDIGRLSIYAYLNRAQDAARRVSIIQMKYRPVLRKICGTAVRARQLHWTVQDHRNLYTLKTLERVERQFRWCFGIPEYGYKTGWIHKVESERFGAVARPGIFQRGGSAHLL